MSKATRLAAAIGIPGGPILIVYAATQPGIIGMIGQAVIWAALAFVAVGFGLTIYRDLGPER